MRTLLTHARASKVHTRHQNSYITHDLEGCTDYISESGSHALKPGEFICVDCSDSLFIALGSSLTIEGVVMEGDEIKTLSPVENAWGATTGIYKVTATKDETVNIYFPPQDLYFSWSEQYMDSFYEDVIKKNFTAYMGQVSVLSLRQKRNMTLTTKLEVFNNDKEYGYSAGGEAMLVFNPNNTSVTFHYDENVIQLNTKPSLQLNDKGYNQTIGQWIRIDSPFPIDFPCTTPDFLTPDTNLDEGVGHYEYFLTCEIESESVPPNFPDIDVKLTKNTIYSEDTEGYSFAAEEPSDKPLDGGVIAAIVIVVVVVVAAIVAVIVCYFLKCFCFKKKDKSSSSS